MTSEGRWCLTSMITTLDMGMAAVQSAVLRRPGHGQPPGCRTRPSAGYLNSVAHQDTSNILSGLRPMVFRLGIQACQ